MIDSLLGFTFKVVMAKCEGGVGPRVECAVNNENYLIYEFGVPGFAVQFQSLDRSLHHNLLLLSV